MVAEETETQLSSTMPGWWRSLDVFNNKHPFQSWRDDGRGLLWRGAALHRLHSLLEADHKLCLQNFGPP